MSYDAISRLTYDLTFTARVDACLGEQAMSFKDDGRPSFVSVAEDILKDGGQTVNCFHRMIAGSPGFADTAEAGEEFDSSPISDDDILSAVQAHWPDVATLYFG